MGPRDDVISRADQIYQASDGHRSFESNVLFSVICTISNEFSLGLASYLLVVGRYSRCIDISRYFPGDDISR